MKTQQMKISKKQQQDVIILLYSIGLDLLKDLANCDKVDYKLSDYGQKVLSKYPKLEKYKKGGLL